MTSPLFGIEVPVLAHRLADPEKATGAAMICTFGDLNDVILVARTRPARQGGHRRDGRFASDTPDWLSSDAARGVYDGLAGLGVKAAQRPPLNCWRHPASCWVSRSSSSTR